jgi:hypothetical protein
MVATAVRHGGGSPRMIQWPGIRLEPASAEVQQAGAAPTSEPLDVGRFANRLLTNSVAQSNTRQHDKAAAAPETPENLDSTGPAKTSRH